MSANDEFQAQVALYKDTVFRIAYSYSRNSADAEDIAQEVFLKLFRYEKPFPSSEQEKAWLIRVTMNQSKDHLRKRWLRTFFLPEEAATPVSAAAPQTDVLEAVLSLPVRYRMAVHLYYYEDYAVREIAEILSCSETAVQTRLQRGRAMLKEKLGEEFDDE